MTDIVERLRAVDHGSVEDCFMQSPLFGHAADEIICLRTDLAKAREESEHWHNEAVHWSAQACDDPGKNPPVFWKDEALRLRADLDAARAALAAERERCAKVADAGYAIEWTNPDEPYACGYMTAVDDIAAAIRAIPAQGRE